MKSDRKKLIGELDRAANGANQKLPRRNVLGKHIYTSEKNY